MGWAFQIRPRDDELLSSFLCRVALAHGATPFGFLNLHLRRPEFWARDIDRGSVASTLAAIAQVAGVSPAQVRALTLHGWIRALRPGPRWPRMPAVVPWINVAGVFHRVRTGHAQQFCPVCLHGSGHLDKAWRLSFVTVCQRHGCLLLDGCANCDAPLMPHRVVMNGYRCHACGCSLVAREPQPVRDAAVFESLQELQAGAYAALVTAAGGGRHASQARADLLGARALVTALLTRRFRCRTLEALALPPLRERGTRMQLEFLRLFERVPLLLACEAMLRDWPVTFRCLAQATRLKQTSFPDSSCLPEWLLLEKGRLPKASYQRPQGDRLFSQAAQIDELSRRQGENWRAARAGLMLKAAR